MSIKHDLKKSLRVIACLFTLALFIPFLLASTLSRSSFRNGPGVERSAFKNDTTGVYTEIICTVSAHTKALHDGEMNGIIYDTTLQTDDTLDVLFYAPTTNFSHLLWNVSGKLGADFNVYLVDSEDITQGAQINHSNYKIGETTDTEASVYLATAVSDTGTRLPFGDLVAAGKNAGGAFAAGEEAVVSGDNIILFRITSFENNNTAKIKLWWHNTAPGVLP